MKHYIGIIGLGYVGLPLAVEFGKKYPTVGFDISDKRISGLKAFTDRTREVTSDELKAATHLSYTKDPEGLKPCNTYIVTVPTPIDSHNRPDITLLLKASAAIGSVIQKSDIVIP